MTPPILFGAGLVALALGAAILRTFGPNFRVGRLLAATPLVTVAEACALAEAGRMRYVRVEGRIDAPDEFIDEAGRPLVHRRVHFEGQDGRRWRTLSDDRRSIPFSLSEGLDSIAVDAAALDEGLVVIPRESVGRAADAQTVLSADLDPDLRVRMRIEHVSSVDHAVACGVPRRDAGGSPLLGPGLGRPLIVTTLVRDDAVRVLAGGSRIRPLLASVALVGGIALLIAGLGLGILGAIAPADLAAATSPAPTATATPSPSPAPTDSAADEPLTGDTRSSGTGPSFIGAPLLAIGGVLAIGIGAAGLTFLYVRLTGGAR